MMVKCDSVRKTRWFHMEITLILVARRYDTVLVVLLTIPYDGIVHDTVLAAFVQWRLIQGGIELDAVTVVIVVAVAVKRMRINDDDDD